MTTTDGFNPAEKMIRIQGGAQYLQVKDRLIWARDDHPDLSVETEVVRLDDKIAVFKATVSFWLDGVVKPIVGTGHGSETPQGFAAGYIEKAETIAVGRALARIGYGTEDALDEDGKFADAPVSQPSRPQPRDTATAPARGPVTQPQGVRTERLVTGPQQGLIRSLMRDHGVSDELMHTMILVDYGKEHLPDLTMQDASAYIAALQALPLAEEQGIKQEPQTGYVNNQYAVPEEPEWVRSAPGNDRHTA